jgi:hypothetical protein
MTIKDLGGKTSGTVTAELFPKSSVARAFSHQLAETLWLFAGNQEHVRSDTPLIQAPIGNTGVITAWPKLLEVECRPEPVVDPTHHGRRKCSG